MAPKVLADVAIGSGAGQWYGTLVVSNIRYDDGSAVTIDKFLGVKFLHPTLTTESLIVDPSLSAWQEVSTEVVSSEAVNTTTVSATAKVIFSQSLTFGKSDSLSFEINGDLTTNSSLWTDNWEFYADSLPSGTVEITVAASPDAALDGIDQTVYVGTTKLTATPGKTTSTDAIAGNNLSVTVDELYNSDQTVVATAVASPTSVAVEVGKTTSINVSYTTVNKYSTLDVNIGQLSSPIDKELLDVLIVGNGSQLQKYSTPSNSTQRWVRQPVSGTADTSVSITLNNVKYSATKSVTLDNKVVSISVGSSDFKSEQIDTTGFVELPIVVRTRDTVKAGNTLSVRLSSTSKSLVYSQDVDIAGGTTPFGVPVAPGEYTVTVNNYILDSTVYGAIAPATITVSSGSTLPVETRKGANLVVKGFPKYLSFGAISDLSDLEGSAFINAKATSIFKYAGNDGAGDPGGYLSDDPATTKTIDVANVIQSSLAFDTPVLPIMISYTCNLSLGNMKGQLDSASDHEHSFGNLILSLQIANKKAASDGLKRSVPAGYIVNADFLGETQKAAADAQQKFDENYSMPVRDPLQKALDHWSVDVKVPDDITDTLKGYVQATNWLIRTVAPDVVFAWQVNLWGVGSSTWVYSRDPNGEGPVSAAKKTADWLRTVGAYGGAYQPDFLAIDRYEADDFTARSYANSYCYGPYEWARFYDFVSAISLELQIPAAPWQVPASRIPSKNETVADLEGDHWGTGGTYLFGDPAVGNDYKNVNPKILAIKLGGLNPHPDVQDLFAQAAPYDLSSPTYQDFPLRGIFTVLLGGGATTGLITTVGKTGPWTQDKVNAYMANPIMFAK